MQGLVVSCYWLHLLSMTWIATPQIRQLAQFLDTYDKTIHTLEASASQSLDNAHDGAMSIKPAAPRYCIQVGYLVLLLEETGSTFSKNAFNGTILVETGRDVAKKEDILINEYRSRVLHNII